MSLEGRKVLIAMDDSKHSDHVFEWYMKNVHKDNDDILMVYSAEHGMLITAPTPFSEPSMACRLAREEDEIDKLLSKLENKLHTAGVRGRVLRISDTTPWKAIMKTSKEYEVDMIVVGEHGHSFFRRSVMGSVSEYVHQHSHIPVLFVPKN